MATKKKAKKVALSTVGVTNPRRAAIVPAESPLSTDWTPGPSPVRNPEKLEVHWSPQPTIARWIAQTVNGELQWGQMDAIRRNAELGLTEQWGDLTRRFLSTDDHVFSCYTTYIAAIAGARREVEAPHVDPEYQTIADTQADMCARMFDGLQNPERSIAELLDGDFTGYAFLEIMWKPRGDWLWPSELIWIHPDRIRFNQKFEPYLWDRGFAAQRALELGLNDIQDLSGIGLALPPNKYVRHLPRLLPNYPMTSGIFLSIMRPWWVKNWCTKFWLSGAEFAGNPRLLGEITDQGAPPEVRQMLSEALQTLSADTTGVIGPYSKITILDPKMEGQGGLWETLIKRCDAAISKAVLGSTLNVEVGDQGGNRSLGESQMDTTIQPRWNRSATLVGNTIAQGLFKPFLELNRHLFGGHVFTPKLILHISEDNPVISDIAVNSGVVRKDELRRSCKLSPLGPENGGDDFIQVTNPADANIEKAHIDAAAKKTVADTNASAKVETAGGAAAAAPFPRTQLTASRANRVTELSRRMR